METFLNRYRNITVLVLVISAQLVLLGYQVKGKHDVPLIRVWAVTAVTPVARAVEGFRSGILGFFQSYVFVRDVRVERDRLQREVNRLKIENQFLRGELSTADRMKALAEFQATTPSKTLAARLIGTGAGSDSKLLFLDRGSLAGVKKGMAVVTPDGIFGRVIAAYPTASQIVQVTDPDFAAGAVSQKNGVRGTLRGLGNQRCRVDYVQNEEKVETGEWFYTSGADRTFPRGFPIGQVKVARNGSGMKEIYVEPAALSHPVEEVLILLSGVHRDVPEPQTASSEIYIAPPPPAAPAPAESAPKPAGGGTEADRLRERYRAVGEAQNHKFGEGLPGSRPPDFTGVDKKPGAAAPPPASAAPKTPAAAPAPQPEARNPPPA
jgi:rod shape-determining protein MreC